MLNSDVIPALDPGNKVSIKNSLVTNIGPKFSEIDSKTDASVCLD